MMFLLLGFIPFAGAMVPTTPVGYRANPGRYCNSYGYRGNQAIATVFEDAVRICNEDPLCKGVARWDSGRSDWWNLCGVVGYGLGRYTCGDKCTVWEKTEDTTPAGYERFDGKYCDSYGYRGNESVAPLFKDAIAICNKDPNCRGVAKWARHSVSWWNLCGKENFGLRVYTCRDNCNTWVKDENFTPPPAPGPAIGGDGEGQCLCDAEYDPVCASSVVEGKANRQTFVNECEANCFKHIVESKGACQTSAVCEWYCPQVFIPVCATGESTNHEHKSFQNPCFAACDDAFILHLGTCDSPQCLPFDGVVEFDSTAISVDEGNPNFFQSEPCINGDVRLDDYPKGSPEVYADGEWIPVCGHYFTDSNAGAVLICKSMGFNSGRVTQQGIPLARDGFVIGRCEDNDAHHLSCDRGDAVSLAAACRAGSKSGVVIECDGGTLNPQCVGSLTVFEDVAENASCRVLSTKQQGCDGFPGTSLAECEHLCRTNARPRGSCPAAKCNYAVWSPKQSSQFAPGWCHLATTCDAVRGTEGSVVRRLVPLQTGSFAYDFDGCCRGGGASKPILAGERLSQPECEQRCRREPNCSAYEVNGCNGDPSCTGRCWLFFPHPGLEGEEGVILNGRCVTNGDQKCYINTSYVKNTDAEPASAFCYNRQTQGLFNNPCVDRVAVEFPDNNTACERCGCPGCRLIPGPLPYVEDNENFVDNGRLFCFQFLGGKVQWKNNECIDNQFKLGNYAGGMSIFNACRNCGELSCSPAIVKAGDIHGASHRVNAGTFVFTPTALRQLFFMTQDQLLGAVDRSEFDEIVKRDFDTNDLQRGVRRRLAGGSIAAKLCQLGETQTRIHVGGCDRGSGQVWFRHSHTNDDSNDETERTSSSLHSTIQQCATLAVLAGKNFFQWSPQSNDWGCVAYDSCERLGDNEAWSLFGLFAQDTSVNAGTPGTGKCVKATNEVIFRSTFRGDIGGFRFAPAELTATAEGCYNLAAMANRKFFVINEKLGSDFGCQTFDSCQQYVPAPDFQVYSTCVEANGELDPLVEQSVNLHCKQSLGPVSCPSVTSKIRTIDGSCNNVQEPTWGRTFDRLSRLLPALETVPRRTNARTISFVTQRGTSDALNEGRLVPPPQTGTLTAWIYQFGQYLAHDIALSLELAAIGGNEHCTCQDNDSFRCLNIDLEKFDPLATRGSCVPFNRGSTCEGENLNGLTGWLDASLVYGSTDEVASRLRSNVCGRLDTQFINGVEFMPFDGDSEGPCSRRPQFDGQCFFGGDIRVSEVMGLTATHHVFHFLHNKIANMILQIGVPQYRTDEQIYQAARELAINIWTSLIFDEYLPTLLGEKLFNQLIGEYKGYDPSITPQTINEFTTASFRLHAFIESDGFRVIDENYRTLTTKPLREVFFNPQAMVESGVSNVLRGLSVTEPEALNIDVANDLRNHLFVEKECTFGFDLPAFNIQRGRDHRIGSYALYRDWARTQLQKQGVDPQDILPIDDVQAEILEAAYGSDSDSAYDLWMGVMAEPHLEGSNVGATNAAIISRQYNDLRAADRFWYQNTRTPAQIKAIRAVGFAAVLCEGGSIGSVQPNPFRQAVGGNIRKECASYDGRLLAAVEAFVGKTFGRKDTISPNTCRLRKIQGGCAWPSSDVACARTCADFDTFNPNTPGAAACSKGAQS